MYPVLSALLDAQHAAFERGDWAQFDALGAKINCYLDSEERRTQEKGLRASY